MADPRESHDCHDLGASRDTRCPYRGDIAALQVRLEHIDSELRGIKHRLDGNGRPGILDQAREHAMGVAERLGEAMEKRMDKLEAKLWKLLALVGVLAGGASAGGSALLQALLNGG